MSVAARSPVQCPAGSRTCWPRPGGVWRPPPVSQSSSRPSATPMQAATVGAVSPGDSGCTWSRIAAARVVSPSATASIDQPQRGDGQVAGVADGGEAGHVAPLDGAVQRGLQGLQVGDVDVADVDAFLGQQRRQLAQRFLRQAGLDLDLRRARAAARGCGGACRPCAHLPSAGRLAAAVATSWQVPCASAVASRAAGVFQPRVLRGRSLSSAATAASRSGPCTRRSLPLGKYWRSRPLVFSLVGRCQGECGSQKNTGMPSAAAIWSCSAISLPWSQVSDRRSCAGKIARAATSASRTVSALCRWPGRCTRMVNRLARSTRVPIADRLLAPVIRSPSQCPASLRPAAAGGPLADHRHPGQRPGPAGVAAAVRLAVPPPGPQHRGQVPA